MNRKTLRAFTALRILTVSFVSGFAMPALMAQSAPSAKPAAQPADEAVVLSPFVISTDADDGYSSTESASASRFKQKLKDIPQTISIMSGQFLKDIGAVDLADVMPLVGGTISGAARNQDTFSIRGFAVQESYLDGFRDVVEWGGGDFVHVQQLEIIKGPSSNLYGNPKGLGGIINRISKTPRTTQWQQVSATIGDYANYHFTADVTGPITSDKKLLYRVNAAYRNLEYNRDFKDLQRTFVAPVFEWRLTPATKISLLTEVLRQDYQEDNWIPSALIAPGVRALTVPETRRIDEPWAKSRVERERARITVEHKINEHLTARVAAQQTYINNPITQVEFLALQADNRTVDRRAFWLNRWEDYTYTEANLFGRYQVGKIEHSFIVAADYYYTKFRSNVRRTALGTIDLLNPVYSNTAPVFPASGVATNTLGESTTTGYTGTYQLNAYDGRVILIGGWRDTKVESSRRAEIGTGPFPLITDPVTKAELPRYGAMVRPLKNVALYYQYSEVFQQQTGGALRLDGSPLAPAIASSEEFGLRLSFLGEKLNFEVVKYEMIADGLALRLPPPNNSFFANGGQTTSDGYEYTLTYNDRRLTLQAGWVDVFVRDTTPGVLGAQQGGQPRYRGQLHARYKWPEIGRHGGLSVGGSVIHTAERPLSATTTGQFIPEYQSFNLNANYGVAKGINVALAVGNVFDKRTIVANAGILWRPLDPRTMKLTVTKSW
jgi:iron complex outermembrane receptor protein